MPVKLERQITLPKELLDRLDTLNLTKAEHNHAIKLLFIILKYNREAKFILYDFIPLPFELFKKVFGSRYTTFTSKLKADGIIETKSYAKGNYFVETYWPGVCKQYRINGNYLTTNFVTTSFTESKSSKSSNYITINSKTFSKKIIFNDLSSLKLDANKLIHATNNYINTIQPKNFQLNEAITDHSYYVTNSQTGYKSYITHASCLRMAKRNGLDIIKDGNKFILHKTADYVNDKKSFIKFNYIWSTTMLVTKQFYASRNKTNTRLDHNLTSASKILLNVIKQDNNVVEIDLANSQFCILAYLMKLDKNLSLSKDFDLFLDVTSNGKLYDFIKDQLDLGNRSNAKSKMMELAFSSHLCHIPAKKQLKNLFPSVVSYIDNFKKEAVKKYGKDAHNRFAIWLQKTESTLFIDNIYYDLKKQGFWVLTKHDSLLVKAEDETIVRQHVENFFKAINFSCTLK